MYENSSILYLKPDVLDHEHVQQMEAKLKGMQKAGNKKILLDLRDVAAGDMSGGDAAGELLAAESERLRSLEGQKVREADVYSGSRRRP